MPVPSPPRGARDDAVRFLVDFDLSFRTRRLRFVARRLTEMADVMEADRDGAERVLHDIHALIAAYRDKEQQTPGSANSSLFAAAVENPAIALDAYGRMLDLARQDEATDARLSETLGTLPKGDRRTLILAYLGYPFYDVATLPLLQGEGLDEFDPIKVDRISPNDAVAIRKGGPQATLKGLQFNSFGAFFSRAYRENDYLWGRLHGADRLIDIVVSTLPEEKQPSPETVAMLKRDAFRAIVEQEKPRLKAIGSLFEALDREIG